MDEILFTDTIYDMLKRQRDWPGVLGRTLMNPDVSRAKMLRIWTFEMFDLQSDDYKDKSDCSTMMACILYELNFQHMLDRIKQDVFK